MDITLKTPKSADSKLIQDYLNQQFMAAFKTFNLILDAPNPNDMLQYHQIGHGHREGAD